MTERGTEDGRARAVLVSRAKPAPGQTLARWLLLELWPNGAGAMTEWYGTTNDLEERTKTPGVRWWTRAVDPNEDGATFTREANALGETLGTIADKIPDPIADRDRSAKDSKKRHEAWAEIEQAIDATLARFSGRWEKCGQSNAGKRKGHKAHWITCVIDEQGEVHLLIDEDRVGEGARSAGTVRGKAWTAYRPVAEPASEAVWVAFRNDLATAAAQIPASEEHIAARLDQWSRRLQITGDWAGPRRFEFAWGRKGATQDTPTGGKSTGSPGKGAGKGVGANTALIVITSIVLLALHAGTTKTADDGNAGEHPQWSISPATHPGWSCADEARRIGEALNAALQSPGSSSWSDPHEMNRDTTHAVAQRGGEWRGYVEAREGEVWLKNSDGKWHRWNIGPREVAPCLEAMPDQR